MNFTFIHTADIHLDSPLRGLAAYSQKLADCFRQASRQAFVHLVNAALERRVAFVIIAGDIFDGDWKNFETGLFFVKEMARLDRAGIPVYAIHGNHDAANMMTSSLRYPGNVKFFDTKQPETIVDEKTGAVLHGQGFAKHWIHENLAEKYPSPQTGRFNIGILHTACEGNADHANYAPCSVEELRNHGYDYWALGHVHGHEVLSKNPYVVFPGNLQGRHIRECGEKGYCLVEVTDGEVTGFEHVCIDVARWCDLLVEVDADCCDIYTLLDLITDRVKHAASEADGKPLAVRVTIDGPTELHWQLMGDQNQIRAEVEALLLSISDEIMLEKLRIKTTEPKARADFDPEHHDMVLELMKEMDSPEIRESLEHELTHHMATLRAKLPGQETILPDEQELAELLEEAKGMVAAQLVGKGGDANAD